MILVIRPDASLEQIEHVIERVRELGFTPHVSRGEIRTIVGVIGDETKPQADNFSAIGGICLLSPYWSVRSQSSHDTRARSPMTSAWAYEASAPAQPVAVAVTRRGRRARCSCSTKPAGRPS